MLMPKRVKYRRVFRGKMRGKQKAEKQYSSVNSVYKLQNQHGLQTVKSKLHVLQ